MTVRVRFAPSPTGYLHIGGARTALYNYLFAKAQGGTFILRIEDTDEERSSREFETLQIADLKWLGIDYDEGPDKPGAYGPYRQSERTHIYQQHAEKLISENKAFYCFCSEQELEEKKELALKEGRAPHYDGKCRNVSYEEATSRLAAGEKAVIRFKAPHKAYVLQDLVRDRVVFPEGMVGDFVIIRSGGLPVYNYCCVIDDWLMKMTHVIRAEEHLSNTVRQMMLYEAFNAPIPQFAHVSLLVGKDRQKLSKRHGATSVTQYKEQNFLPEAVINYIVMLGWSHPEGKEIMSKEELSKIFALDRLNSSPAMFDIEKFNWVNGEHLKTKDDQFILENVTPEIPKESLFHQQSPEWKLKFVHLFKEHIQFYSEMNKHLPVIFDQSVEMTAGLSEILAWPTTPQIKDYLVGELATEVASGKKFVEEETFNRWSEHIKKELKVKGKPLFMGMRGVLTGKEHGPELKFIIPLTPLPILQKRIQSLG